MGDLLIRDLPDDVHDELKRRAALVGKSLQSFVRDMLVARASRPTMQEWVDSVNKLPRHPEIDAETIVRAVRGEPL